MSKVGIENYAFEEKNEWRKKAWSEVARRVKNPKNARVIYLAGEQNLDQKMAMSKGFRPYNMVAVEMDKSRTEILRKSGVTTINENLMDVLHNWPEKHKVDVVIADFCFGFESSAVDLYDSLENKALTNAVVIVNFQRGRDASTNKIRDAIARTLPESGVLYPYKQAMLKSPPVKHRAFQYLFTHAYETAYVGTFGSIGPNIDFSKISAPDVYESTIRVLGATSAKFLSYKSNRVYMDSAIFSHNLSVISQEKRAAFEAFAGFTGRTIFKAYDDRVKRVISAALAVGKMRKKKSLTTRNLLSNT